MKQLKKGKNIRRFLSLLLMLALIIGTFSGCDKKDEKKKPDNTQSTKKGRYMEENISLPKGVKEKEIINVIEGKDKTIELFSFIEKTKEYEHYIKEKEGWKKTSLKWLNSENLYKEGSFHTENFLYGEDGNYYVLVYNYDISKKSHTRIYQVNQQGNGLDEIKVNYTEKPTDVIEGREIYPYVLNMKVLKNGNFLLEEYSTLSLIDRESGEKINTIELNNEGGYSSYGVSNNDIMAVNKGNNKVAFYEGGSRETKKTIDMEETTGMSQFYTKEDGTLLLANRNGIQQMKKDGSLWEIVVDGTLNSMSMPSLNIHGIFVVDGDKDSYIIVYEDGEGNKKIMQYQCDESVSAVPENEITIYSLTENSTVRQAISAYQRKNSNVKVNYIVSMEGEGENKADYIRALNTELLNGNGADILILDGLPVDSYIEKGVLLDLKDFFTKLGEEDKISENIRKDYVSDNRMYSLPSRFFIPIIYGNEQAVNAWTDLDSILDFAKSKTGKTYMEGLNNEQLLKIFLTENQSNIFSEDKQLKEEEFKTVLENIKQLTKYILPPTIKELNYKNSMIGLENELVKLFNSSNPYMGQGNEAETEVGLEQVGSIHNSMVFLKLVELNKGIYHSANNLYIPSGEIGINKSSKNIEASKEFLKTLFSEEVQGVDVSSGFPVNGKALEKWFERENKEFMVSLFSSSGENQLDIEWPNKKARKQLYNVVQSANRRFQKNNDLIDIMVTESIKYLNGESTIEQVTNTIKSKVDTYLAE